jgi:hypothetical protein
MWRKNVSSDPRSFRRPKASRPPAKAILIVTEGEVTEPTYFEVLRRKLSLLTVEVAIVPKGCGDPRRLAEYALDEAKKRKKLFISGKLGNAKAAKFDELWIVFDTDIPVEHGRLADGLAFAAAKGVQVAHSTPCFEYWLLLHRDYTTAPMPKCADVIPRLSQVIGQDYTKNANESKTLIPPLLNDSSLATARANAERVRKHHAEAGTVAPPNPSTEVDRLIDALDPPPMEDKTKKRFTRKRSTS